MAERIVEQLIDDIDGSDISDSSGEQMFFSFRDIYYQIDLSAYNLATFEKVLQPYIDAATKLAPPTRSRPPKISTTARNVFHERSQTIRLWARKNGHTVASRGRISAEVVDAFDAAHADR